MLVWDFGWTGHGTPAPIAPPKKLVVIGFYRYVRHPMYVGFAACWIGLWFIFGHPDPIAIAAVAAVALDVHLFVGFYEEPTVRKAFGKGYEEYCRNVGAGDLACTRGLRMAKRDCGGESAALHCGPYITKTELADPITKRLSGFDRLVGQPPSNAYRM